MSSVNPELSYSAAYTEQYFKTVWVDVIGACSLHVVINSDRNALLSIQWSMDQNNIDKTIIQSIASNVVFSSTFVINARYVRYSILNMAYPTTWANLRIQTLNYFVPAASGLSNTTDAYPQIFKPEEMKIRAVYSPDSSVMITQHTDVLAFSSNHTVIAQNVQLLSNILVQNSTGPLLSLRNLIGSNVSISSDVSNVYFSASSAAYTPLTKDIQITGLNIGVGRGGGPTNLFFAGPIADYTGIGTGNILMYATQDTGIPCTFSGTGNIIIQQSKTFTSSTASNIIAIGQPGSVSSGANSIVLGKGQAGANSIHIGYSDSGTLGNESIGIGYLNSYQNSGSNCVAIGPFIGFDGSSLGAYSVCIGGEASRYGSPQGGITLGWKCARNSGGTNSIHIGQQCANNATSGSLNFGNAMEARVLPSSTTPGMESAFIPITWNGTAYRLVAVSSTTTTYTHGDHPIGELSYYNATGATIGQNTDLNPGLTLTTTSNLTPAAYFDQPIGGRLRYLRSGTQVCHVAISLSATTSTNNQEYTFIILKNGVKITNSDFSISFPNSGKPTTLAYHIVASLTTNDYLTVQYSYKSATADITFQNVNIVCMGSKPAM